MNEENGNIITEGQEGNPPAEEHTPTFDEMLKVNNYQSEFDKRVGKALETAKTKWAAESAVSKQAAVDAAVIAATNPLNEQVKDLTNRIENLLIAGEIANAGANDPADIIGLIDRTSVSVNDGKVEGLDVQIDALKKAKPYLFREEKPAGASGLSHDGGKPASADAAIRKAMGLPL